ncbi:MAG: copper-translocating P-type ATPase, partial [Starkeya sp.]|nr:copper-translocating P-type ATPase [Starkeya sp.]
MHRCKHQTGVLGKRLVGANIKINIAEIKQAQCRAAAYAGQPFFQSALRALKSRSLNMDVPITLGVLLALSVSVFETLHHAEHAYFDSAVMLLFFLLAGRYLDHAMRRRTRAEAGNLAALKAVTANRIEPDGRLVTVPAAAVKPGDEVMLRAGERAPVDGIVLSGTAAVDESLVTGETLPRSLSVGATVHAGSLIHDGVLRLKTVAAGEDTFLDEIERLLDKASTARGRYIRLADRAARLYAPMVHTTALLALVGWLIAGASLHQAVLIAVAVLIITCPCAIGLAVPAVQVVATGALLKRGVLLRSGDALERLARIDQVAFDKTGTLTSGAPTVTSWPSDPEAVRLAAALAAASRHPVARALHAGHPQASPLAGAEEIPGEGLRAPWEGGEIRLGRAAFCGLAPLDAAPGETAGGEVWLTRPFHAPARFLIEDTPRPEAARVVAAFAAAGLPATLLSGDHPGAVARLAEAVGIGDWQADRRPGDKLARLVALRAQGRRVLMVGDGLNDAPALAGAFVSASFAHGAPASQSAADLVLPAGDLAALPVAWRVARRARGLILQNLILAALYNMAL